MRVSEELSCRLEKGLGALLVALRRVYGTRDEESGRAESRIEVHVVALLRLWAYGRRKPEKRGQCGMEAMCLVQIFGGT